MDTSKFNYNILYILQTIFLVSCEALSIDRLDKFLNFDIPGVGKAIFDNFFCVSYLL